MTQEEIKTCIPHRDPFLFLDRVIEKTETSITCEKTLTGDESFFRGHFPGKPIMPGVLMIEALAQTGAVLLLSQPAHKGKIAYLASVSEARFRKMVVPGDKLVFKAEMLKIRTSTGLMKGVATVDGQEACSAEILFSFS